MKNIVGVGRLGLASLPGRALTNVTNVTDQPLFGQEDSAIWPQLSDALLLVR
jgi:hypothetical protein